MNGRMKAIRRRATVLAVAAIVVVALGGTALAGHIGSDVKSYTGCLVTSSGTFVKVKEGDQPQAACSSGQVLAHLSGGDITSVTARAGGGLEGGSANGAAALSIRRDCDLGEIVEWNGTAWVCGTDSDSTYTAGTGLDLSASNAFSIEPGFRIPGKACSTSGEFARGFDSTGTIQCAAPGSGGPEVWQATRGVTFLPKGEGVDLAILSLPSGTYLITAKATVSDWSGGARGDEELSVRCSLRNGAFADLPVEHSDVDIAGESSDNVGPAGSAVVHGLLLLATADTVRFTCFALDGDDESDEARHVTMTAVKVGTVHTP